MGLPAKPVPCAYHNVVSARVISRSCNKQHNEMKTSAIRMCFIRGAPRCKRRGCERACPVCTPAEARINNFSGSGGRLRRLVMIIGARGVNGSRRKFTVAQIAQVGCHGNLNMTGKGKSGCEVTVFVQRINSGAREADLRGKKVGGCMWLEQQSFPPR